MTETVIPPVRAGKIGSELEFEYEHDNYGEGGFSATGEYNWQFDMTAYNRLTGLDIGGEYPYAPQENGHTLRIITEYAWTHNERNDTYSLSVEQTGVRGTYSYETYFTRCGYFKLNTDMEVSYMDSEPQQYGARTSDKKIPHYDMWDATGRQFASGEQFVRSIHEGIIGPSVEDQLMHLIEMDTPDDAIHALEYDIDDATPTMELRS